MYKSGQRSVVEWIKDRVSEEQIWQRETLIENDTKKTTMALTDNQTKLNKIYQDKLGRDASFGTKGGASYWLDNHAQGDTVDWDNIANMIGGSQEGQKFAADGKVRIGGLESNLSTHSQGQQTFADGTTNPNYNVWAGHFQDGGSLQGGSSAAAANAIAAATGQSGNFFQQADADIISKLDTGATNVKVGDQVGQGWWNQFADADAFKTFLQGDAKEGTKSDGMGDFMKFMMLMNVMGGGRGGGGGGYGGSQFGYGGMSPGGVQAAYNPMEQLQGMGTWFKDNFGSSSASTDNLTTT